MELLPKAGVFDEPGAAGAQYVEHLRSAGLSIGTYSLRAGATDSQQPHTEDEVYVVTAGRAQFTSGESTVDVSGGAVIFVPAGEPHRFHDITEDLTILVLFGPPEGSASP